MAATKTFVNYKSDLLSFAVANEQFLGIIDPGRVRGFDTLFTPTPGLIFNLLHDVTGIKKVRIDGNAESPETGVVFTRQGTVAQFEGIIENLAVNTNDAGGSERIDVIYFQHSYQETTSPNLGVIGIEQGTVGGGEPPLALPTQMVKIGTVTMPAGADQVQESYYEPAVNVGVGGAAFALEETVIGWLTSQDTRRKNDLWPFYDDLARFVPSIAFGATGADIQPSGLNLRVPTINDLNAAAVIIGDFYAFMDGVICYFPGGTFNLETDGSNDKILWFQRGTGNIPGDEELPYDVVVDMVAYIGDMPNTGAVGTFTKPPTYNNNAQAIGLMAEATLSISNLAIHNADSYNDNYTLIGAVGGGGLAEQVDANTAAIGTNSSNIQGNTNAIASINTGLTYGSWVDLTSLDGNTSGWAVRKNGNGDVQLSGSVGTIGVDSGETFRIGVVPIAYRPLNETLMVDPHLLGFDNSTAGGGRPVPAGELRVATNGDVFIQTTNQTEIVIQGISKLSDLAGWNINSNKPYG